MALATQPNRAKIGASALARPLYFPIAVRAIGLLFLLTGAGCLGSAHKIPKSELTAVAHEPPAARGEELRVVQGFAGDDEPPEDCCASGHVHAHGHAGGGGEGGGGGKGGGGKGGGSRPSNAANLNIDDARVLLIAGAVLTVALAASEGSRFSGWVEVEPDHPVHLRGPRGEYARVPLADLDPETAAWAEKAYVRPEDGPLRRLDRAPLNRRGFNWSMLVGAAEIGGASGIEPGFMSHMQLGGFFTHEVGLVFDLGIGWRGEDQKDTVYQIQGAGELQYLPFSAGRVHAGGFAQVGGAARSDDGAGRDTASSLFAGGGLLQLDITTFLALTARAGVSYAFDEQTSEVGLGLSIY